jgi:hypothetical protein
MKMNTPEKLRTRRRKTKQEHNTIKYNIETYFSGRFWTIWYCFDENDFFLYHRKMIIEIGSFLISYIISCPLSDYLYLLQQFIQEILPIYLFNYFISLHKYITTETFMAYTEEQTSGNKLKENDKVGKGNYVTFEGK